MSGPSEKPISQLSMFSAAGSPAKTSAELEQARDSTEPGPGSGSSSVASSKKHVPASSSSRTSRPARAATCPRCGGLCATSDTEPVPLRFLPPTSARHIVGDVSSSSGMLFPTPTASTYGTGQNGCHGDGRETFAGRGSPSLTTMARHWPTASATDYKGVSDPDQRKGQLGNRVQWPTATAGDAKSSGSRNLDGSKAHPGVSLTDAVTMGGSTTPRKWPTPQTRDEKGPTGMNGRPEEGGRRSSLSDSAMPRATGGRLNPDWVSVLMGFPEDWLHVDGLQAPKKSSTTGSPRAPSSERATTGPPDSER